MSEIEALRSTLQAELDALTAAVDDLESVVEEVESTVTENKLHDVDTSQAIEQTNSNSSTTGFAAD